MSFLRANWIWFAGPIFVMVVGALVIAYLLSEGGQITEGNVPYELI